MQELIEWDYEFVCACWVPQVFHALFPKINGNLLTYMRKNTSISGPSSLRGNGMLMICGGTCRRTAQRHRFFSQVLTCKLIWLPRSLHSYLKLVEYCQLQTMNAGERVVTWSCRHIDPFFLAISSSEWLFIVLNDIFLACRGNCLVTTYVIIGVVTDNRVYRHMKWAKDMVGRIPN